MLQNLCVFKLCYCAFALCYNGLECKTLFLNREWLCSVFLNVFSNASDLNVKVMINYWQTVLQGGAFNTHKLSFVEFFHWIGTYWFRISHGFAEFNFGLKPAQIFSTLYKFTEVWLEGPYLPIILFFIETKLPDRASAFWSYSQVY